MIVHVIVPPQNSIIYPLDSGNVNLIKLGNKDQGWWTTTTLEHREGKASSCSP